MQMRCLHSREKSRDETLVAERLGNPEPNTENEADRNSQVHGSSKLLCPERQSNKNNEDSFFDETLTVTCLQKMKRARVLGRHAASQSA